MSKSFYTLRKSLKEEAPVNATGPAIAGVVGEPPVPVKRKKPIILRRKNTK